MLGAIAEFVGGNILFISETYKKENELDGGGVGVLGTEAITVCDVLHFATLPCRCLFFFFILIL